jgi:hypothetical protein
MGRYDRLIAFLEEEARVLKDRIAWLKRPELPPSGITSGDTAPGRTEEMRREAEAKLAEIKGHISDLKWDNEHV